MFWLDFRSPFWVNFVFFLLLFSGRAFPPSSVLPIKWIYPLLISHHYSFPGHGNPWPAMDNKHTTKICRKNPMHKIQEPGLEEYGILSHIRQTPGFPGWILKSPKSFPKAVQKLTEGCMKAAQKLSRDIQNRNGHKNGRPIPSLADPQ